MLLSCGELPHNVFPLVLIRIPNLKQRYLNRFESGLDMIFDAFEGVCENRECVCAELP